jgi:16S rRNA (cytosine967-C5)-methyltransferase
VSAFFDLLKNWDSVEKALAANNEPVAPNLIAWPGKSTREELLSLGGSALKIGRSSILADRMPTEYPAIRERRAGVQDCGSQLLTEIFFETAKEINSRNLDWLDLCAGPGGKAAYLQALISTERSSDTFTANEPSEHRAKLVQSVVNLKNVISLDGRNASEFPGKYDRILVDAPCSGLGALRRRPEARWRKNLSDLKGLIELQRDLLDSAYTLLKPGGIVGYATCSPHLLETKGQVLDFAHRHKEATQISISIADTGIEGAINSDENMQLWTHVQKSDSMFLALFQKPE